MPTSNVRVTPLRGTAAVLTRINPVLLAGEVAYETDTGKTKLGDGTSPWNSLSYQASAAVMDEKIAALNLGTAATRAATDFDPAGTAAGITLNSLGGVSPSGVDTKIATQAASDAATYQPIEKGTGVAALGDSITANFSDGGADPNSQTLPDHYLQGLSLNGSSPIFRGIRAQGGYRIEQIAGFVPTILAMSPRPAVCVVLAGTNNAQEQPQVALGRIVALWDALVAGGVQPVAATIPPRTDLPAFVGAYNEGIRRLARQRAYDLLDFHAALTDPATGTYKTGLGMLDSIHPTYAGAKQMALVVQKWAASARLPRIAPPIATSVTDSTDLLAGAGLFLTDGNGDGVADHIDRITSAGPFSIVTDADGINWQRITVSSTAPGDTLIQFNDGASASAAPGDVLEIAARVQTSGFDAALHAPDGTGPDGGTGPSWILSMVIRGNAGNISPAGALHTDMADGVLYARAVAGSTATGGIQVNFQTVGSPTSGSVWAQFGQVAVRNLTQLAAERIVNDVVTTASSATITSATAAFTSADIGKPVQLFNADASWNVIVTTITGVTDGQTATLGAPAGQNTTGKKLVINPGIGL